MFWLQGRVSPQQFVTSANRTDTNRHAHNEVICELLDGAIVWRRRSGETLGRQSEPVARRLCRPQETPL